MTFYLGYIFINLILINKKQFKAELSTFIGS